MTRVLRIVAIFLVGAAALGACGLLRRGPPVGARQGRRVRRAHGHGDERWARRTRRRRRMSDAKVAAAGIEL